MTQVEKWRKEAWENPGQLLFFARLDNGVGLYLKPCGCKVSAGISNVRRGRTPRCECDREVIGWKQDAEKLGLLWHGQIDRKHSWYLKPCCVETVRACMANIREGCIPSCIHDETTTYKRNRQGYLYLLRIQTPEGFIRLGYGITNVIKNRLQKHSWTFANTSHTFDIADVYFLKDGGTIADLETLLKKELPLAPIDCEGFRTECTGFHHYEQAKRMADRAVYGVDDLNEIEYQLN